MKPLKILTKGEVIDYQTVIEETFGEWIAQLKCYDANWDRKEIIGGVKVIDRERAYFVPDDDYELILRKKR